MKKLNARYLAVIAGCALFTIALNLPFNCTGLIFTAAISDEIGFTMATASLFWTIRALSNGLTAPLVTKLYLKTGSRTYLIFLELMSVLCYVPMALYRQPWLWVVSAAALGVCNAGQILILAAIIDRWFKVGSGTLMGICNAASGLVTALFSPLLSSWIVSVGWQRATVGMSAMCFGCVLLAAFALIPAAPEKVGLRPYGEGTQGSAEKPTVHAQDKVQTQRLWPVYVLITIVALSSITINCMNNYLPTYASSLGHALAVGAMLTSVSSISSILVQLVGGYLCDRIGSWRVALLVYGLIGASVAAMLAMNGSVTGLVIGSAGIGICFFPFATLLPKLTQASFGNGYETAFGKINAMVNLTGTATVFLMGLACSSEAGFTLAFEIIIGLCLFAMSAVVCVFGINRRARKKTMS